MYTRKYTSRYEILKKIKKKKREKNRKTYWISNRALKKFVISNKQNIEDNLGKKLINEW